ncbi:unnamed protein product [Fusarium fujikuroi]|uniref:Uncharacterized protein n=1 Tax=Fusarium fujikuroi TaxID=5127 RepID=A0A9Q9UC08_FUSFU|nr:unnamed protein product [Fusarium fujikuroi]
MLEDNPQENSPSENFATGNTPQSLYANAATDMIVYEAQNEPNYVPSEVTAEDISAFVPQDLPDNMQVNNQSRPEKGKSRESIPQDHVYGNNVSLVDELERQTGSRVHFDENSSTRRSRKKEPRKMDSHRGNSHRRESHRGDSHGREPHRTDYHEKKSHKKESHHSRKSESHRSESHKKDSHSSGSDRKDSHRPESRRSDPHRKESHGRDSNKSSKKEDSHKKTMIDASPEYGRISLSKTINHYLNRTPYIRTPVETKKRGN